MSEKKLPGTPPPSPNLPDADTNPTPILGGRGIIGSIVHEVNLLGQTIGHELNVVGKQIGLHLPSNKILELFQTGKVIQLISRASGHSLEVVQGPDGKLVVDGKGPVDPNALHTLWTVIDEGFNQVRLHNNNNCLAVVNGITVLLNMPPGTMHGIETKFQLSVIDNFVLLESMKERRCHVGILPSGDLKPAVACGREDHAHFGVLVVPSPPPATTSLTSNVSNVQK